jgi:hypothetical protein
MTTISQLVEKFPHSRNLPTFPREKFHNRPTKKGIEVQSVYKMKNITAETRSPVFPIAIYIAIGKTIISKTIKNPRTSLRRKQTLELIKTTKKRALPPQTQILAKTINLKNTNKKLTDSIDKSLLFQGRSSNKIGALNKPRPTPILNKLTQTITYHLQLKESFIYFEVL